MTHTISKLGKVLALPLAATLLASFSIVGVCAASIPASIPASTAQAGDQQQVKKQRAKRAVKTQKKVAKKAVPQPAGVEVSQADAGADGLALKQSHSISGYVSQPSQAYAAPAGASGAGSSGAASGAYAPRVNPYLVNQSQSESAPESYGNGFAPPTASGASSFRLSMPQIPLFEQSILPKVQTVYPTGEKPLVVVTFKCPTELVGIDTPSTLILHKVVNGGMDIINKTNLLSFNMQQVCQ